MAREDSDGLGTHRLNWPPRIHAFSKIWVLNNFLAPRRVQVQRSSRWCTWPVREKSRKDGLGDTLQVIFLGHYICILGIMAAFCQSGIEKSYISGICTGSTSQFPPLREYRILNLLPCLPIFPSRTVVLPPLAASRHEFETLWQLSSHPVKLQPLPGRWGRISMPPSNIDALPYIRSL